MQDVTTCGSFATLSQADRSPSSFSELRFSRINVYTSFLVILKAIPPIKQKSHAANYLSSFIRNTGSYLSPRGSTPTTDCRVNHSAATSPIASISTQTVTSVSSALPTSTQSERPSHLPVAPQIQLDAVSEPCAGRSPMKGSFAGLAGLNSLSGGGILMRGTVTGAAATKPPAKPANRPPSTTVTYLPGFNALLVDSQAPSASPQNDKRFVGKLPTIKTLRKGGYV